MHSATNIERAGRTGAASVPICIIDYQFIEVVDEPFI